MRVKIVEDENTAETEVVIYCRQKDEEVCRLENVIHEAAEKEKSLEVSRNGTRYYVPLSRILFFETAGYKIQAHTAEDLYETDLKLYQLEEMLPGFFLRISKSTIVNVNCVYAVSRNLTASSVVEFQDTHKQVYVSRHYFKLLRERLEEKRIRHE